MTASQSHEGDPHALPQQAVEACAFKSAMGEKDVPVTSKTVPARIQAAILRLEAEMEAGGQVIGGTK